ncbi:MAG TPA: MarR family transcriptional regulator [Thermoanaerobaculia bacterium]|nr:MarR family transcriptional regulator [Thermoanaerobaculia bacterium]
MAPLCPVSTNFIERMALCSESDGLPRIAGRILALLAMRQEPVAFDEIAECLQVSRASVSTNTRLLESRGVIRRTSRLGERKDLFEVSEDLPRLFLEHTLSRHREMRELAAEALRKLPRNETAARNAMQEIEEFHTMLIESNEKMLATWRKRKRVA